jgi:hypothetical protein
MTEAIAEGADYRRQTRMCFANALGIRRATLSVDEKLARSLEHLDEFRFGDFAE